MKNIITAFLFIGIGIIVQGCGGMNVASTSSQTSGGTSATYTISGTITGSTKEGVTLTLGGAGSNTAKSNSSGAYSFPTLSSGTYTVTPSLSGYTFSPTSRTVTIESSDKTSIDFVATSESSASTRTISGTITGATQEGVSVLLSGGNSKTTISAPGGNFSFISLSNGTYIITPSLSGYTFTPTSRAVTIESSDKTSINFTASASTVASGSWKVITTSSVPGLEYKGVAFFNDDQDGLVAGQNQIIVKSTNVGATWSQIYDGTGDYFNAISIPDDSSLTAYTVGSSGIIAKTADIGASWTSQTSEVTQTLVGVDFITVLAGWAVGGGGILLKTTDGGQTWTNLTSLSGTTHAINGVDFVDSSNGCFVGGTGSTGIIRYSTNGGSTWGPIVGSWILPFNAIHLIESGSGIAVGNSGTIVKFTGWGGAQTISNDTTQHLRSVFFIDKNTGWIVGDSGTILKTSDGGLTWSSESSGTTNKLNNVKFINSTTGFAIGANATILKYSTQ